MEKTKKMTKRDYYETLYTYFQEVGECKDIPQELMLNFLEHEIDLLNKKNSSEKKPSATALANNKLMATILDEMVVGKPYTCSDIIKSISECSELSTPKVSYLMNALADAGKVVKSTDKKKTYFTKG